jgi:hypothetical protein
MPGIPPSLSSHLPSVLQQVPSSSPQAPEGKLEGKAVDEDGGNGAQELTDAEKAAAGKPPEKGPPSTGANSPAGRTRSNSLTTASGKSWGAAVRSFFAGIFGGGKPLTVSNPHDVERIVLQSNAPAAGNGVATGGFTPLGDGQAVGAPLPPLQEIVEMDGKSAGEIKGEGDGAGSPPQAEGPPSKSPPNLNTGGIRERSATTPNPKPASITSHGNTSGAKPPRASFLPLRKAAVKINEMVRKKTSAANEAVVSFVKEFKNLAAEVGEENISKDLIDIHSQVCAGTKTPPKNIHELFHTEKKRIYHHKRREAEGGNADACLFCMKHMKNKPIPGVRAQVGVLLRTDGAFRQKAQNLPNIRDRLIFVRFVFKGLDNDIFQEKISTLTASNGELISAEDIRAQFAIPGSPLGGQFSDVEEAIAFMEQAQSFQDVIVGHDGATFSRFLPLSSARSHVESAWVKLQDANEARQNLELRLLDIQANHGSIEPLRAEVGLVNALFDSAKAEFNAAHSEIMNALNPLICIGGPGRFLKSDIRVDDAGAHGALFTDALLGWMEPLESIQKFLAAEESVESSAEDLFGILGDAPGSEAPASASAPAPSKFEQTKFSTGVFSEAEVAEINQRKGEIRLPLFQEIESSLPEEMENPLSDGMD